MIHKHSARGTSSYIRQLSSDIRKIFPSSPCKFVAILKHIWFQAYKCPVKQKLMKDIWPKDGQQGSLLLQIGKHHAKKNSEKLRKCVHEIKMKYKSLHHFSNCTDLSWTQFRRYCKVDRNILNSNN